MSLLVQAASYLGNYALSSIVYFKFSVTDATGVLTTLGGSPVVKVYKDAGTTESTAGVTLTVDFDSRTGMCQVAIDTSSDGTFYAAGSEFEAVITTGTVGVVSVAGTPVGHFSLLNRVDTLANGVTHGGTTAKLRLGSSTSTAALQVTNSSGHTVVFSNSGGGSAFYLESTGADIFPAIWVSGGALGATGVYVSGSGNSNTAVQLDGGTPNGVGLVISGAGTSQAVQIYADQAPALTLDSLGEDALTITTLGTGKHDVSLAGSGDLVGKLAANALDNILVESSITAGAGLTNDAGTQLTTLNLRQALALIASAVDGVLAGAAGTSITTKPAGKPSGNTRVTATVDSSGNRSALTLKVPT